MLTRKKSAAALSNSQIHSCNTESTEIGSDKKLKLQQKDKIGPAVKSRRGRKKVPVDLPSPQIQRSRKRSTETADPNKSKKLKTLKNGLKEPVKTYCWVCHKSVHAGQTCTCRRIYHDECLEKTSKVFSNNKCPECQLKSVNGTELTRPFIDGLKVYLESATKWLTEKHKSKMSWPQNSDIVPSLDVEALIKKVQNDSYKTTAEFYADVKWFYHDLCILLGENSKHSKDMKNIIKEFKEELFDMEACPECYYHLFIQKPDGSDDEDSEKGGNSNNEKNFVRLCNPPHDIVWAKVSGYSHFPAKCLKVINGKARVRFFGKHEKADIQISMIFRISQAHPVYENRNITAGETRTSLEYTYAKRELLEYITIYKEDVGDFPFFRFRVFYDPDNVDSNTREKTGEPGLFELTTASPTLILTPSDLETQKNTFCANTHNMSPVSPTESVSTIPDYSMATLHGIQIKEEFRHTNQISPFAESSNKTSNINLMQILENALMSSISCTNGSSTSSTESCLASIHQNINYFDTSEKTILPSILVPNLTIIKEEFNDCLPLTSEVHERQIATNSTENASGDQQPPEPEVGSSNSGIAVIDLTGDDDSTPQLKLSEICEKNPDIQILLKRTHKDFDLLTRMCAKAYKKQTPEPNQMFKDLTKKLDETEKKFQAETEKLKDRIKHLEKNQERDSTR